MTDPVRLVVNGGDYGGWKSVSVTAGIDRHARDFTLAVTDRWPGATELPRRIRPGDACQLHIGADLVLTGHVDATPISYDAGQVSVGVTGRSRTGDLVDCSAITAPGQWRRHKAERIAAALAAPYGIAVRAEVDTGAAIAEHQVKPGESVFESIERLLELRALLATDDAAGNVVLTRAGSGRAATALELGRNILSAAARLDFKDRFSEYRVKGQRAGDDLDFGEAVAQTAGTAADSHVPRRRVLVIKADGQADAQACRDRARWEAVHRAGKSLSVSYAVQGWRQENGALWRPNLLVRVRDPIVGIDGDMLIAEVTWRLDDGGMVADLTVVPKAAYELLPEVPKGKGGLVRPGETLVSYDGR